MLVIDVRDNDNLEKALKVYKKKFEQTGVLKQLRSRKHFIKESIKRRQEIIKATYRLKTYGSN
jgi:small subunit ribosomal protein S21